MKYTGSIFKRSRRLGFSLLENSKEFSKGKKRKSIPGQHGNRFRSSTLSGYAQQLQEKQRMQYMYGITDKQFRRLFRFVLKQKGNLTVNLFRVLESRLDNIVYRMGFAPTRKSARQMVNHGHVILNDQTVDTPSIIINPGDKVRLKARITKSPLVKNFIENSVISSFVETNKKAFEGTYIRFPERSELPAGINESYVVEWYKRLVK